MIKQKSNEEERRKIEKKVRDKYKRYFCDNPKYGILLMRKHIILKYLYMNQGKTFDF